MTDNSPVQFDMAFRRGVAAVQAGRIAEALTAFDAALSIQPRHFESLAGRGYALMQMQRYNDALAVYDVALTLRGNDFGSWYNRGAALYELARFDEAILCLDRALVIQPANSALLKWRALSLQGLNRTGEALKAYREFLRLFPTDTETRALAVQCALELCDWRTLKRDLDEISGALRAGNTAVLPFTNILVSHSAEEQLMAGQRYSALLMAAPYAAPRLKSRYGHERMRVAYISGDFNIHPVSMLLAGVIEHHDRERIETIGVSYGPDDGSEIRKRLSAAFETFIDVRDRSDDEIAALLRHREIDVAVDLMGHGGVRRSGIFARQVAPVLVNYLGFPATMGAPFIDYIIADKISVPENARCYFSENVVYLPDTMLPTDSKRAIPPPAPSRREAGLPETGFVFAAFNAHFKFLPQMFDIWMRVLEAVPGSVLWLRTPNPVAQENLQREAQARGVDPSRLVFAPHLDKIEDHLARLQLADLYLNTLPYNAHTNASDALWAGVPVLTQAGATFAGRIAAGMLHAIGLPEMVAQSAEEYETLALGLARDPARLAGIRAKLAVNRETYPLFDTARYTRHLEAAFQMMWERHERGEAPVAFAVESLPPHE